MYTYWYIHDWYIYIYNNDDVSYIFNILLINSNNNHNNYKIHHFYNRTIKKDSKTLSKQFKKFLKNTSTRYIHVRKQSWTPLSVSLHTNIYVKLIGSNAIVFVRKFIKNVYATSPCTTMIITYDYHTIRFRDSPGI